PGRDGDIRTGSSAGARATGPCRLRGAGPAPPAAEVLPLPLPGWAHVRPSPLRSGGDDSRARHADVLPAARPARPGVDPDVPRAALRSQGRTGSGDYRGSAMSRTTERAGKLNQASTILSSLRKIRRCGARTSTFQPFLRPWDLRSQTALLASPRKRKRTVRLPPRTPPELLSRRNTLGTGKSRGNRGWSLVAEANRPGSRRACFDRPGSSERPDPGAGPDPATARS